MPDKTPDSGSRRIAVFLGSSGPGQALLNVLGPLLDKDSGIDLQGVFAVDSDLRYAADLPFVKELCRLTFSVREFHGSQFERTIALRARSAHKAMARLAQRMDVAYTFQDVHGSTVSLLQETVLSADITFFEPVRKFATQQVSPSSLIRENRRRIVVAINGQDIGAEALSAATLLAEGRMQNVTVLMTATTKAESKAGRQFVRESLPADPAQLIFLTEPGLDKLIEAVCAKRADILIVGASEETLKFKSLQSLLDQLPCPACLVRRWSDRLSC